MHVNIRACGQDDRIVDRQVCGWIRMLVCNLAALFITACTPAPLITPTQTATLTPSATPTSTVIWFPPTPTTTQHHCSNCLTPKNHHSDYCNTSPSLTTHQQPPPPLQPSLPPHHPPFKPQAQLDHSTTSSSSPTVTVPLS